MNAARKLRNHRREERWADKNYKKRALGTAFKHQPFGGSSHAKGIVLEKMYVLLYTAFILYYGLDFLNHSNFIITVVSKPNSPTLLFVNVSVPSSSRTERKSLLSFLTMVA
jgi:hypothetical protein